MDGWSKKMSKILSDEEIEKLEADSSGSVLSDEQMTALETQALPVDSAPSKFESFVRGAAQGATLGLVDEATAALGALGSLTNEEKLLDAYRRIRDESRQEYKKAQKANPTTYLGGNLASALIPGLGAIGAVQKAVTIPQKVGAGMKAGAAIGALTGLGTSEADATKGEIVPLLQEAKNEALFGAGIGAGFPLIGASVKGVANLAGKTDFGKYTKLGFDRKLKGESLSTDAGNKEIIRVGKDFAKDVFETMDSKKAIKTDVLNTNTDKFVDAEDLYNASIKKINKAKLTSEEKQNLLDIVEQNFSKEASEVIKNAKVEKIIKDPNQSVGAVTRQVKLNKKVADDLKTGEFSPTKTTEEFKQAIGADPYRQSLTTTSDLLIPRKPIGAVNVKEANDLLDNIYTKRFDENILSDDAAKVLDDISGDLRERIKKSVPELGPLNESLYAGYQVLKGAKFDKNLKYSKATSPSGQPNVDKQGNVIKEYAEQSGVSGFIEDLYKPTAGKKTDQKNTFKWMRQLFSDDKTRGLEKRAKYGKLMRKVSEDQGLIKNIGENAMFGGAARFLASASAGVAGLAGKVLRPEINKVVIGPTGKEEVIGNVIGKTIKPQVNEKLSKSMKLANNLMQSGNKTAYDGLATFMEKTNRPEVAAKLREVARSPQTKKNAAIFAMLQKPAERAALEEAQSEIDTQQDESTEE
jgi:hypothetical protein